MSHYGTKEDFAVYVEARGKELPVTADDAALEAALLVASEWLDGTYNNLFTGHKTDGFTQAREWPRSSAYTNTYPQYNFATNEIPDRVINATYEAAYREINTPGSLLVDYKPSKYKSVSISGALSVDYANINQASDIQIQISAIEQLLAPLFNSSNSSSLSGSVERS